MPKKYGFDKDNKMIQVNKPTDYVKQGKRNRINGADFERRVRRELEKQGWIVSKWQNNLDYPKENINLPSEKRKDFECIPAKASRFRLSSTGFPDFICYQRSPRVLIFVEVKTNGKLDKQEREKAKWYLDNDYCDRFFVASKYKEKNRIQILLKEIE